MAGNRHLVDVLICLDFLNIRVYVRSKLLHRFMPSKTVNVNVVGTDFVAARVDYILIEDVSPCDLVKSVLRYRLGILVYNGDVGVLCRAVGIARNRLEKIVCYFHYSRAKRFIISL